MKRGAFASTALAVLIGGCDLIPGTEAYREERAKSAAAQLLIDPTSAQFRNVAGRDGSVCGEINGKNRMGAYVGFTRFYVDSASWEAALDPQYDDSRLQSVRRLCASIGGSSCDDEAEEETRQLDQRVFDSLWQSKCGGSGAPGGRVSLPWDPTAFNLPVPEENWVEQSPPQANASAPSERPADPEEDWFTGDAEGADAPAAATDSNLASAADINNAATDGD